MAIETNGSVGAQKVAERGSAQFYREQAIRISAMAIDATDSATRIELLEIASGFQRLAAHADAKQIEGALPPEKKSA